MDVIKLTNYISEYVIRYGISRYDYHNDLDEDNEPVSGIFPDGNLDEEKIKEVLEYTGLTREEWFSMSKEALHKYDKKYPFFRLDRIFSNRYDSNNRFIEPYGGGAYWGKSPFSEGHFIGPDRYDVERIRKRISDFYAMLEWQHEAESYDDYFDEPDISEIYANLEREEEENQRDFECVQDFSEDTIPTNRFSRFSGDSGYWEEENSRPEPIGIKYTTESAFSFPKYGQLIRSLFQVIQRYKELFVKTIKSDLTAEEIDDMNFLATALGIRDAVCDAIVLNHRNVLSLKEVYQKESLKDFFSYVKFAALDEKKYWACYEFAKDRKSAEALVHVSPSALRRMREYVMLAGHFSCWFFWSNAVPPFREREEDEEEALWEDEKRDRLQDKMIDPDEASYYEELMQQGEHIYVEKDESDYLGEESHFDAIRALLRPESRGGVPLPRRECEGEMLTLPSGEIIQRREAREQALAQAGGVHHG